MIQMDTRTKILIVDDDPEITSVLERGLALHGYATVSENQIDGALALFRDKSITAAIVDVMIGDDSGIALVRKARGEGNTKPVLMLSALSEVEDRAQGLEAGADDYIVKPFAFDELVARLKVQERRAQISHVDYGCFEPATRTLRTNDQLITLTEREAALLKLMCENQGRVLSRGEIFDTLWAVDGTSSENVVDVYVGYLRKKLALAKGFGFEIQTIRNRGFVLDRSRG